MASYNDLVEQAKKIGLKNRTKYRTIATLSDAIAKHKNISIPYRNLDQLKVIGLRKISAEYKVPGWTKDRTRESLVRKIREYMEPPGKKEIPTPPKETSIPTPRKEKPMGRRPGDKVPIPTPRKKKPMGRRPGTKSPFQPLEAF